MCDQPEECLALAQVSPGWQPTGRKSLDGDSDDIGFYGVVWPRPFLSSLG